MSDSFVSATCGGEHCCVCGKPAQRKLCEEIPYDDPEPNRHPYSAYVCYEHFSFIVFNKTRHAIHPRSQYSLKEYENHVLSSTKGRDYTYLIGLCLLAFIVLGFIRC